MINSLSNKVVFVYNLLLPIIYLLATNLKYFFNPIHTTNRGLLTTISFFWAYIIIVTLLNMVIFETLTEREYGYYKEFFFITGSKWYVLIANFLVQVTILFLEIILFDVIFLIVFHTLNLGILLGGILAVLLFTIPVTSISCLFLTLKIKLQTVPIIETVTLFALFSLAGLSSKNPALDIVYLLNPVRYLTQESYTISMAILGSMPSIISLMKFIAITLVYLVVGVWGLSKFSITPIENRS